MGERAEFWYIFGLAAVALIVMRLRGTRLADWRDPMAFFFTLCLFLPAFGTLSKQPFLANGLDRVLGVNSAWLVADILFITGVCAGAYWIDMLGPLSQPKERWSVSLLARRRLVVLIAVAAWMVMAAKLEPQAWVLVERGGIDVAGNPILLLARLAYFGYSIWALVYLSRSFYNQRQQVRDRQLYIRLSLPWAAITLALAAPVLQVAGTWEVFIRPEFLPVIWPPLWRLITVVQIGVALLILAIFFEPAYRFIIWLDKQMLVWRLGRVLRQVERSRPDLFPKPLIPEGKTGLVVADPDSRLITLVNEFEFIKKLIGPATYSVEVPAGSVMPGVSKLALEDERTQLLRGLSKEAVTVPQIIGAPYELARWYAAVL